MISDFIYLEVTDVIPTVIKCSLPDPDEDSDYQMVECGQILIEKLTSIDRMCINIEMFDNFKKLCIGDSYQRSHFATTVVDVIQMKIGCPIVNPVIKIKDFMGDTMGNIAEIDDTIWVIYDEEY